MAAARSSLALKKGWAWCQASGCHWGSGLRLQASALLSSLLGVLQELLPDSLWPESGLRGAQGGPGPERLEFLLGAPPLHSLQGEARPFLPLFISQAFS